MTYLPDVNVWIALVSERHKFHTEARRWFGSLTNEKLAFCRITQLGFLRLVTNRHVMDQDVLSPVEAWQEYLKIRANVRIGFHTEPSEFLEFWYPFMPTQSNSPNLWTDSYLCAFCFAAQLTLVTFDLKIPPREGVSLLQLRVS
jgi:uncharacterized protein